ncbi:uncharacterized protein LOC110445766 [Mizuhopecten yessoensis]|uniref:uncharacterized protein LOC110445766 n=1 Tax=Mizuhopecten yessoensis TaxID=6573 RepID=UPI000B4578E7|nr:uncharacterized protein LOC110445766 [Mizuhopecten yessoensis]
MGQTCGVTKESKLISQQENDMDVNSDFKISIHDTISKVTDKDTIHSGKVTEVNSMVTSRASGVGDTGSGEIDKSDGLWVMYDVVSKKPSFTLLDHPTIVSSFLCPCDVHSICPNALGQAWTCDMFSNDITLIDNIGYVLQQITCRWLVDDISLADDRYQSPFLLCSKKKTVMDLRCPKSIFKTRHRPTSLCYSGQNHVVVGTKQTVTMYTNQGDVVGASVREDSGIIWPWRMSVCRLVGNIAVIDTDLKKYGGLGKPNILVMDNSLKPLFRYRGRGSVSGMTSSFEPSDLAYDSYGNLVVADYNSRSLELISGEGKHLKTLHTDAGRIQAVGIQIGGKLPRDGEQEPHSGNILWVSIYYPDDEDEMDQIKLFRYYS